VPYSQPEPLDKRHIRDDFTCGEPALDDWLKKHAAASQASDAARVFVTTDDGEHVVGYYALAAGSVEPSEATDRLASGQPAHRPIPVVILARLAVHVDHQGVGLGRSLLRDAMEQCLTAADRIGVRAMVVHAKDEEARCWYQQYDFEDSPTDPFHLILLMKDLRKAVQRSELE
jgi:GNAT superfamily N-acetyltransferase